MFRMAAESLEQSSSLSGTCTAYSEAFGMIPNSVRCFLTGFSQSMTLHSFSGMSTVLCPQISKLRQG